MTIDEAIRHCEEVAERYDRVEDSHADDGLKQECIQCAADHRQLAEWLRELKELREKVSGGDILKICELEKELAEAKRLLKLAVEDFDSVVARLEGNDILCMKYIACKGCPFDGENCNKWRGTDEALKLLGGNENEIC